MEVDTIIDNLKSMLIDRGDNIDEFIEHEQDIERDEFYNDSRILEFHTSNTTIIFAMTKKLRKNILDELKNYTEDITKFILQYNNKKNIILIFNNDVISAPILLQLNKYDKMLQKKNGMLQYFYTKQLLFNPTKHVMVPEHTKLTTEKTSEIMEKYLIKSKLHMPIILHSDIIAKWLGLKQGDVVEIKRYNSNSGLAYYYRCCV
jgi:DNA-directed RNA polymerase subunit H (RpoH/RPB5)